MRSIVVGTAGHIDHGKSALVLALTGTDPDRLKEEKARGITIDLGFAHARVGDADLAFVDVPGHERFVKNMLAGVGGIDAVMLVIAADESVMPQTREHFAICRLLQIPAGLIVLTKADLVDAETLEIVRLDARELVAGSRLESAPILTVSAKTGEGLDELRRALERLASAVPERASTGLTRLPVDRVFSMRGFGTVVTGTLTSGSLALDDELLLLPADRRVKVRGVQVHGAVQPIASAGRRVAVNLGGVDAADVTRGETLTRAGAFDVTRRFDALVDLLPDAKPLRHGARIRFHQGTLERLGRVALAVSADAQPAGDARGLTELRPGQRAFARIRLEGPAVLTRGDRFILRQYSPPITIGGGWVVDPLPARTPIRSESAARRFARLAGDGSAAALAFIEERRASGLALDELARRLGHTVSQVRSLTDALSAAGKVRIVGGEVFDAAFVSSLEERLVAAVAAHHQAQPLSEGLPREEARERVFGLAPAALFDSVVKELSAGGRLTGRERLALPGRGVSLNDEETRARDALDRVFREAGMAPPDLAGAAAAAGVSAAVADRMAKLLVRQKTLVKLDTLLFHAESLDRLKQDVRALKTQGAPAKVDVAGFKERYGISRKYAIPLLEWLDRERVTRRTGDARIVL
ncbi:MAG TPA: selenocysteine-specific translation elongation factor [Vicinamibacterales bacterium]|nr:selenocysteine-specific translation elongation factor [Vicinamibacterales bacterium]